MEPDSNPTKLRVLVLDDEPVPRDTTVALLEAIGHEVTSVETCDEARKHLYNGNRFDVLVSDIATEGTGTSGGYELAMELRREGHYLFADMQRPRVALVTGYLDEDIGMWCKAFQIPVLEKPYKFLDLKKIVERLGC